MPHLPKYVRKNMQKKPVDTFRLCQDNYRESSRKFLKGEGIKQNLCMNSFLKDGHHGFIEDFSISLIDRTDLFY